MMALNLLYFAVVVIIQNVHTSTLRYFQTFQAWSVPLDFISDMGVSQPPHGKDAHICLLIRPWKRSLEQNLAFQKAVIRDVTQTDGTDGSRKVDELSHYSRQAEAQRRANGWRQLSYVRS